VSLLACAGFCFGLLPSIKNAENVDATIGRTLQERRRIVGERKYRKKDGSLVDAEVGVSIITYDGGEVICTIVRDVTERKRAEDALTRSENRLRTIIETEPECVKVLGMDGSLLEMNPAGLSMIEADSLEQVRGKPVYEYIAPEHRHDFVALTERVLYGGSGTLEFELLGLKGTSRWLETHAVPLRDAQSDIVGLLAITRDVTGRKENEEALRQSEQLFRAVIEQATENIFLVDAETGRIVEFNPAFQETLGYAEKELKGMTLYDVVADDRENVNANVRRVLEGKGSFVGVRQARRKDGSLLDVEVSASTILLGGREAICAVAHDVTERARAQQLLEERLAILSRVATRLTLDLPVQDTLDAVAESVVNASTAVSCSVILVDAVTGLLNIEGSHGLPEGFKAGIETVWRDGSVRSPTIEALRTRRPALDNHMRQRMLEDPLYAPVHRSIREVAWDTVFIVPLISKGRTLGVLNLGYPEGQQPGEDERFFLGAVADQAAVAVENTVSSPRLATRWPSKNANGSPASCTTPSPRRCTASPWAPGPLARCWISPPSKSPTRSTTSSPWPTRASPRCAPSSSNSSPNRWRPKGSSRRWTSKPPRSGRATRSRSKPSCPTSRTSRSKTRRRSTASPRKPSTTPSNTQERRPWI
jgi:PAS domain S-box-containing protein